MAKTAAKGAAIALLSGSTYTTIAQVKGTISIDLGNTDQIDVTTHDNSTGYRDFVNGFKNPAEVSFVLVYDSTNTQHLALRSAHGGAAQGFRITFADTGAEIYTFSALVTGFKVDADLDGANEATVTIKPTGTITVT